MLTFNEACKIAYDYYADQGFHGLMASNDLGDKYSFMGNIEITIYGGVGPITVSKETGEIEGFLFFTRENMKALDNSIEMEIPDEYKPKKINK